MDKIKFILGKFSFPDFFATNCNKWNILIFFPATDLFLVAFCCFVM
jgi:hypothetical protein